MRPYDRQGEGEAEAVARGGAAPVAPVETVEDAGDIAPVYAGAGIAQGEQGVCRSRPYRQDDLPSGGRELDGIIEQIRDDALEAGAVPESEDGGPCAVDFEAYLPVFGGGVKQVARIRGEPRKIDGILGGSGWQPPAIQPGQ